LNALHKLQLADGNRRLPERTSGSGGRFVETNLEETSIRILREHSFLSDRARNSPSARALYERNERFCQRRLIILPSSRTRGDKSLQLPSRYIYSRPAVQMPAAKPLPKRTGLSRTARAIF
jgi:hypothetical protein